MTIPFRQATRDAANAVYGSRVVANSHISRIGRGRVPAVDGARYVTILAAAAALLAGCGGQPTDKAGGKGGDVRVLRLANANDQPDELAAYAQEVKRISGGRLRIEFANNWRSGTADSEPGILDDVRAGKVDLAWVGARSFKAEGVKEFDPLIAPFEVTDYDTEQRVLADPVAREMLDAVDTIGVQGVALLPGPLRRLGMRKPWTRPADLEGKRIDVSSGINSDAIRALGAIPVVGGSEQRLQGLDGSELHLPAFLGNHFMHEIPYVASQPLWPRPLVVIAAPAIWKRLDADDRATLLKAGTTAALPMFDYLRGTDRAAIPKLCREGARFFDADLEALRTVVAPVVDHLRDDPKTSKIIATIDHVQTGRPAPLVCEQTSTGVKGGIPAGEYTWTLTKQDARTKPGGKSFGDDLPDVMRAVFTPGHMVMWVSENGRPEVPGFEADYSTFKDRVDFDSGLLTARWKVLPNGDLTFSDTKGEGPADIFVFETHPWKRVR